MNTTTPVTTPEGQYVTVWTEPRQGYPGIFTVRTTAEGGTVIKRDGFVQFCHVRGADRAIAEHANQVAIAQAPESAESMTTGAATP